MANYTPPNLVNFDAQTAEISWPFSPTFALLSQRVHTEVTENRE